MYIYIRQVNRHQVNSAISGNCYLNPELSLCMMDSGYLVRKNRIVAMSKNGKTAVYLYFNRVNPGLIKPHVCWYGRHPSICQILWYPSTVYKVGQ